MCVRMYMYGWICVYVYVCMYVCVCMQDEISELAKQVIEGRNRYEAVQLLRRKVSVGKWGGRKGGKERTDDVALGGGTIAGARNEGWR